MATPKLKACCGPAPWDGERGWPRENVSPVRVLPYGILSFWLKRCESSNGDEPEKLDPLRTDFQGHSFLS